MRLNEFLTYTHGIILLWFLVHPACAQPLEQLIAIALASHPSAQAQTALVQSSQSGVDSARWQYYPTPSLSIEAAGTSGNDTLYQGDNRVAIARSIWQKHRATRETIVGTRRLKLLPITADAHRPQAG